MKVYPDTSFLASLYIPETDSHTAARIIKRGNAVFLVTLLAEIELANAFEQRVFRKELRPAEARQAYATFLSDLKSGVFQQSGILAGGVYRRARQLSRKWTSLLGTRTLDLLHVAAALDLRANALYTFDGRQAALAKAAGLATLR